MVAKVLPAARPHRVSMPVLGVKEQRPGEAEGTSAIHASRSPWGGRENAWVAAASTRSHLSIPPMSHHCPPPSPWEVGAGKQLLCLLFKKL